VFLTPKEYRMLQLLAQRVGNVVTHQFLLKEIWGVPHLNDTHYPRIFMRKLRPTIEADPTQPRMQKGPTPVVTAACQRYRRR
jgi:two-component system, OmpR family, KDP operon response regulator KdpE